MHRLALLLALIAPPVIAADTLIVCTATWCAPCQQFRRDLEADPALIGNRNLRIVDVDQEPDEARRLGARNVPTFILLHDHGHELRRTTGYKGPHPFRRWLDAGRH